MPSNNEGEFVAGDVVEVWSNSRRIWFVGNVEEVVGPGGHGSLAEGCVKVRFGKKLEKWILPRDFGKVLRRHVPRAYLSDLAAPPLTMIKLVRQRYYAADRNGTPAINNAGAAGPSGNGAVELSLGQFAEVWIEALKRESAYVGDDVEQAQIYANLGIVWKALTRSSKEKVSVDEWMHHSLLLVYPPGHSVKQAIGNELEKRQSWRHNEVLSQLVSLWIQMDRTADGRILITDLEEALKAAGRWSRDATEEAKALTHDMDGDGLASVCYCDFAAKFLKLSFVEVCLSWYDLTGGWSSYISPVLLWRQEGGIWHTGLVAFSKEFYYSGRIFRGRPGATPFGMPTKIQRLGLTLKTSREFENHISSALDSKFTEVNYDVLEWNCNNFTDTAALFLLEQQIPEEVRLQPERAMNAPIVKMLRPLLNQWLGRIEGDSGDGGSDRLDQQAAPVEMPDPTASTNLAMERAKALIGSDRVALYLPPGSSKPVPAQVQKRYRDGSCDIIWYEMDQPKQASRVPASKLKYEGDAPEAEASSCSVS